MNKDRDFYSILGVDKSADARTIKKTYMKRTIEISSRNNQDEIQDLKDAYDVLSDQKKREIYDKYGEAGLNQMLFESTPNQNSDNEFIQKEECDESRKPAPVIVDVDFTLEQLFTGCTKKLKVSRTIIDHEDSKIFDINVKPGWKSGTKIMYPDDGNQYKNQLAQDLCFVIKEKAHDIWQRVEDDLITSETITLKQALCGFKIIKKGIDGNPVIFESQSVISPGDEIRVPQRGMPTKDDTRGDAILKVQILFPSKLDENQKELVVEALPDQ